MNTRKRLWQLIQLGNIMAALISIEPLRPEWRLVTVRTVYNNVYFTYEDCQGNRRHESYESIL